MKSARALAVLFSSHRLANRHASAALRASGIGNHCLWFSSRTHIDSALAHCFDDADLPAHGNESPFASGPWLQSVSGFALGRTWAVATAFQHMPAEFGNTRSFRDSMNTRSFGARRQSPARARGCSGTFHMLGQHGLHAVMRHRLVDRKARKAGNVLRMLSCCVVGAEDPPGVRTAVTRVT